MIIHQPHGLQVGVHDGGSDEGEPTLLEGLAQGLGFGCHGGHLRQSPGVVHFRSPPHVGPEKGVEAAALTLHCQKGQGILPGGEHLESIPNDARILQNRLQLGIRHGRDPLGIEAQEGLPVGLPLAEDGDPAQPCLGPLQDQLFEELLPDQA